jgi:hypothetical protein
MRRRHDDFHRAIADDGTGIRLILVVVWFGSHCKKKRGQPYGKPRDKLRC